MLEEASDEKIREMAVHANKVGYDFTWDGTSGSICMASVTMLLLNSIHTHTHTCTHTGSI